MNSMHIKVVRFNQATMLGKSLEPFTSIGDGDPFERGKIRLSYYNDTFLKISYTGVPSGDYHQFVPWQSVATCLFTEDNESNAKPAHVGGRKASAN